MTKRLKVKGSLAMLLAAVLLAGSAVAATKTSVRTNILSIAPGGDGRAVLQLDRGSGAGLRRGMTGDVIGLDVDATLIKVSGRRSQAVVNTEARRLKDKREVVFTL